MKCSYFFFILLFDVSVYVLLLFGYICTGWTWTEWHPPLNHTTASQLCWMRGQSLLCVEFHIRFSYHFYSNFLFFSYCPSYWSLVAPMHASRLPHITQQFIHVYKQVNTNHRRQLTFSCDHASMSLNAVQSIFFWIEKAILCFDQTNSCAVQMYAFPWFYIHYSLTYIEQSIHYSEMVWH